MALRQGEQSVSMLCNTLVFVVYCGPCESC